MDIKDVYGIQAEAVFICTYRKRAESLAEEIIGSSGWDDEDIGMMLDAFHKKKFNDNSANFSEFAENWLKKMKADPKRYADFKEYNWGSIDYLIRLSIKMFGMETACKMYGDQIRDVYFDCDEDVVS